MTLWLILFGGLYLALLAYATIRSKKTISTEQDFFLGGRNVGTVLGFLTFSATLFSTFTLMGMPDFFRQHGIGAWIFLGVTDTALAFVVLWFGVALRLKLHGKEFQNVGKLLESRFQSSWARYVYWFGIFVFLIPYVAIQIKGVADFLNTAFGYQGPSWIWAAVFLAIILIYSYIGGLKAVMFSDAIQGIILLVVTFIIAFSCLKASGGLPEMFHQVRETNPALLSAPGPKGLFSWQFLLASFVTIILMPVTQPQLFTRIVVMKDRRRVMKMAVGIGVFAFLIILPTVFIGTYGALRYPHASTAEFLVNTLLNDQPAVIAALAVVGLIAAAMSTADSQLFALQHETARLGAGSRRPAGKPLIILFSLVALLLSIYTTTELALLARVSFAGTALMAPMILAGIFSRRQPSRWIVVSTFFVMGSYLLSVLFPQFPKSLLGLRMDLALLIVNSLFTGATVLFSQTKST
jgi:SSS family solute:Na+ symporter